MTPGLYRLVTRCAVPLAKLYLRKRAKKQPDYLLHWDERFAETAYPAPCAPRLWVHAVSVGETNAAAPLIEALMKRFDRAELLLTCMTPTGRDAGRKIVGRYPGRAVQCYLPYDVPEFVEKFLEETRPTMGILMETEVWPNLIAAAKARGIPMILANARESQKSSDKAEGFDRVMRPAFAAFDAVLAQSEADAARLIRRGARKDVVTVAGSLKFDVPVNAAAQATAAVFKAQRLNPVVLIASTRDGEEEMFAPLLKRFQGKAAVLLVPRHPQRFNDVAELLAKENVSFVRRSAYAAPTDIPTDAAVILGDSMGEMAFYCAAADVTLMGGSFGNTGCQNLIEPAAAGSPVILGPSVYNFAKISEDAVAMGAALPTTNAAEGVTAALRLIDDAQERRRRHEAALAFARRYTGAAAVMSDVCARLWPENGAPK